MMERRVFHSSETDQGERLDRFLSRNAPSLTRSYLKALIAEGRVLVDGKAAGKAGIKLKSGQEVTLDLPPLKKLTVEAEDIPLNVVFEDEDVIVINKPQGMVVHPAKGHYSGTLVNALLFHCRDLSGINGTLRPGIVHRLDKDTSGLMMAAKNDAAHASLASQIKKRQVKREYMALVYGTPAAKSGTIDAPLGRHPSQRKKIAVRAEARGAVTHFQVIEKFADTSLLHLRLETGRTHQIRVHLAYIGHPVLGDPLYGRRKEKIPLPGQALHACRLAFAHPRTGHFKEFTAEPPASFQQALAVLRGERGATDGAD
jgi:23S rRNA pseudouridine1911/1915/1917 synthase